VSHSPARKGEAVQLGAWIHECLDECYAGLGIEHSPPDIKLKKSNGKNKSSLGLKFSYDEKDKIFEWAFCDGEQRAALF